MAEDLALVREYTNTTDDPADEILQHYLDLEYGVFGTSALVWSIQAGKVWKKVSAASGNTRLELQQQFDHAKEMYEHYNTLAGGVGDEALMESVTMAAAYDMTEYEGSEYDARNWVPSYWWNGDVYS